MLSVQDGYKMDSVLVLVTRKYQSSSIANEIKTNTSTTDVVRARFGNGLENKNGRETEEGKVKVKPSETTKRNRDRNFI
jgi:hypothetical protein